MALKGVKVNGTVYKFDYEHALENKPQALPAVTTVDAGKFLKVNAEGVWTAVSIDHAEEVTF